MLYLQKRIKVAVCTFIGSKKIYDRGLYKRLVETIVGLVKQDGEAEVLFGAHIIKMTWQEPVHIGEFGVKENEVATDLLF